MEKYRSGIICGGLENGSVELYNPDGWLRGVEVEPIIARHSNVHHGPVKGLEFNPNQPFLLGSAATEGEFIIWDLNKMERYNAGAKSARLADVTSLGWNRLVPYVVALTSNNGCTVIFDLRAKKDVLTLTHPDGKYSISSVAWSPEQATQMVISSDNDAAPVIYKYDMRNAQAPELAMRGHEKGVLSVSWCPKDAGLLISGAKDNRHLCWSPYDGSLLAEFPSSSNWIFDVQWCVQHPSIMAACSFDGKIALQTLVPRYTTAGQVPSSAQPYQGTDFFSTSSTVSGPSLSIKNVPSWLRRRSGVSFAFGSKLLCFGYRSRRVGLHDAFSASPLLQRVDQLNSTLYRSRNYQLYCEQKASAKGRDSVLWGILGAFFDSDPRLKVLNWLGFTHDHLSEQISRLSLNPQVPHPRSSAEQSMDVLKAHEGGIPSIEHVSDSSLIRSSSSIYSSDESEVDHLITKAIVMGDFESAVHLCLNEDRLEDAFMLATYTNKGLVELVHNAYLDQRKAPFIHLLRVIRSKDITSIVEHASPYDWKDVLAMICTTAEVDRFNFYCEILARRLEEIGNDKENVILCNICAGNVTHVLQAWLDDFNANRSQASSASFVQTSSTSCAEHHRNLLLVDFMERCELLLKVAEAMGVPPDLDSASGFELAKLNYAKFLAEHGRTETARMHIASISISFLDNLMNTDPGLNIFLDRLAYGQMLGTVKPAFPGTYLDVFASVSWQGETANVPSAFPSYFHDTKPVMGPPFSKPATMAMSTSSYDPNIYGGGGLYAPNVPPVSSSVPYTTSKPFYTDTMQAYGAQAPSYVPSHASGYPTGSEPSQRQQPLPPTPPLPSSSSIGGPTPSPAIYPPVTTSASVHSLGAAYHDPPYVAPKRRVAERTTPVPLVSPFTGYSGGAAGPFVAPADPTHALGAPAPPRHVSYGSSTTPPPLATPQQPGGFPVPPTIPAPITTPSIVAATMGRVPTAGISQEVKKRLRKLTTFLRCRRSFC